MPKRYLRPFLSKSMLIIMSTNRKKNNVLVMTRIIKTKIKQYNKNPGPLRISGIFDHPSELLIFYRQYF